ncbi:MAG TPA: phosphopentomutase [Planctomycetota bacterium]|nr:phosphopentomutase [Planctomycetota bacterium]
MSGAKLNRVILVVLDSCGCGALPDAPQYGDEGADTLGNLSRHVGGLTLPHLQASGLGHLTTILGVPPVATPRGAFGKMREASAGKDTTTGHWEMCGLQVDRPFPTFPDGFPAPMIDAFSQEIGRGVLGNKPASGTTILDELGPEHMRTGAVIVYTSADSVFQIAAHEEIVPLDELYRICEIARRHCDALPIARVIARPFVGKPGAFQRTYNRRDFSMPPPEPTVLDALADGGVPVVGIGKIWDIFAGQGVTENIHSEGNRDGLEQTLTALDRVARGLIFVNLVDFDMLYGHRRDPAGYYRALQEFDAYLPRLVDKLGPRDLLLLTADHGNDPTFRGTDHTREFVPILAIGGSELPSAGRDLGVRDGFYDIGATLAEAFGLPPRARGRSLLPTLSA